MYTQQTNTCSKVTIETPEKAEQVNNLVDNKYTLWPVLVFYQECVH